MNGPLEWFGAIGTILAAGMIAADLGRRVTGWAFVLFVFVSIAWIVSGFINGTPPLAAQNLVMLGINAWGMWQYLLSPKNKKKLEKMEELEEQAELETRRDSGNPA